MSLEDEVRKGVEKGLNDYNQMQRINAENAAKHAQLDEEWRGWLTARSEERAAEIARKDRFLKYTAPRIEQLIRDGDYPEAVKLAETYSEFAFSLKADALWKWGMPATRAAKNTPKTKTRQLNSGMKPPGWEMRTPMKRPY